MDQEAAKRHSDRRCALNITGLGIEIQVITERAVDILNILRQRWILGNYIISSINPLRLVNSEQAAS